MVTATTIGVQQIASKNPLLINEFKWTVYTTDRSCYDVHAMHKEPIYNIWNSLHESFHWQNAVLKSFHNWLKWKRKFQVKMKHFILAHRNVSQINNYLRFLEVDQSTAIIHLSYLSRSNQYHDVLQTNKYTFIHCNHNNVYGQSNSSLFFHSSFFYINIHINVYFTSFSVKIDPEYFLLMSVLFKFNLLHIKISWKSYLNNRCDVISVDVFNSFLIWFYCFSFWFSALFSHFWYHCIYQMSNWNEYHSFSNQHNVYLLQICCIQKWQWHFFSRTACSYGIALLLIDVRRLWRWWRNLYVIKLANRWYRE